MQSGSPAEWAAGVVNASRSLVGAQPGDLAAAPRLVFGSVSRAPVSRAAGTVGPVVRWLPAWVKVFLCI